MNHEIDISLAYMHITSNIKDRERRGKKFKEYVSGYIEKSFPELNLVKIEGMKAKCEKR